jgi:hypothetical protein
MDNPYLNRGESIILTTHRVSLDSVPFDAMLTTERLILIDDRYTRSQRRTIMLESVNSVRGGKIPTGEPVLMLSLTEGEGEPQPLNLVFSQQQGEKRTQERDNWVKKIMALRVDLLQKTTPVEISPVNHEPGMHPSVRHWVAPEKIRPLKNVITPPQEPIPFVVIPDEPDASAPDKSEEPVVFKEPMDFPGSVDIEWPVILDTKAELQENSSSELPIENERSELSQEHASQDFLQPAEVADFSVIHIEEPESSPEIIHELVSERDSLSPFSNKAKNHEESPIPAEIHETPVKPQFTAQAPEEVGNLVFFPHPENASDRQLLEEIPAIQTFSQQPELETVVTVGESNGEPISPAPVFGLPGSLRHPEQKIIINACIILVSILLLTSGIMILSSHLFKDTRVVGEPIINSTPIIEQIPTIPPVLVPQTGLWVRINFSGYYIGQIGNPDFLQPVSGTGNQFYKILNSDDLVQVAVEKQDNSGNPLSVEVYKEGILIYTRTITAPMGSIELLIDAKTARPPGITVNVTSVGNRSGSVGRLEYF